MKKKSVAAVKGSKLPLVPPWTPDKGNADINVTGNAKVINNKNKSTLTARLKPVARGGWVGRHPAVGVARVLLVKVPLGVSDRCWEGVLGQRGVAAEQLRLFYLLSGHLHTQTQQQV